MTQLLGDIISAAERASDDESLEASWARLQASFGSRLRPSAGVEWSPDNWLQYADGRPFPALGGGGS